MTKHKVFISYHHDNDQWAKEKLLELNSKYDIFIDRSVDTGDISDDLSDLIHTNIYLVNSFEELERYVGYLDGIERMLEQASHLVVA